MTSESFNDPFVSIIIVNYNGEDLLYDCLTSVENQEYKNFEIILVDNASGDKSVELVRNKFPFVKIIQSENNLGFAGGNNLGARSATGEYVVLLNNDTVVTKSWLIELLKTFNENNAGVVTSKVITENVPQEYYEMNGSINYIGYNIMRVFSDLSTVYFAGGASLLLKREQNEPIFPDEYFLYQEDVFLSWKMRLLGKKVMMSQGSIVYHKGSATTRKQLSAFSTFYQERNRLLNSLIFYNKRTLLKLSPYFIADGVMKVILSIFFRRKSLTGIIRSYYWIMSNIPWIFNERNKIQSKRKVDDSDILKWMSYKVNDSNGVIANMMNWISKNYSFIVGLPFHD